MKSRPLLQVILLTSVMLAAAVSDGCWAEKKPATWDSATAPEQFERLFWESVKAKDWQQVSNHLAPNFVFQSFRGTENKDSMLARLRTLELQEFSLGDVKTETNGADIVVTYTIAMQGSENGQPLDPHPLKRLAVWQQVKRGWILIGEAESK